MMLTRITNKQTTRENGQGIVEFALVLPVLLLLIFGVIEFGRLMFIYSTVVTASREAVRYGSAVGTNPGGTPYFMDCSGMIDTAMRLGSIASINSGDVAIQYDHGPSSESFSGCPPASPDDIEGGVDRVIVQVSTTYQPIVPLVEIPGFPITSQSARTIMKDIEVGGAVGTPFPTSAATTAATFTPTATTAAAPATATASATATATATSLATSTSTSFPTATSTDQPPPEAPRRLRGEADKGSGNSCVDIEFSWQTNSDWETYPGSSPIQYQITYWHYNPGGQLQGNGSETSSSTEWSPVFSLGNNDTITVQVQAIFSGGLGSELLADTFECDKGDLED